MPKSGFEFVFLLQELLVMFELRMINQVLLILEFEHIVSFVNLGKNGLVSEFGQSWPDQSQLRFG